MAQAKTKRAARPAKEDPVAKLRRELAQAIDVKEQAQREARAADARAEATFKDAEAKIADWRAQDKRRVERIEKLTDENNQLRGMVRAGEIELARRAGYQQAIEDAKPPQTQVVELPRKSLDEYRPAHDGMLEFSAQDDGSRYSYQSRNTRRGWWERAE